MKTRMSSGVVTSSGIDAHSQYAKICNFNVKAMPPGRM